MEGKFTRSVMSQSARPTAQFESVSWEWCKAHDLSISLLIGLLITVLSSCQQPSPSCYLLAINSQRTGQVQLFERAISEFKTSFNLVPQRIDRELWKRANYSLPNRVEVDLFLHKRTGKVFLQFRQRHQGRDKFSEDADKAFEEFYVALGRAASPSHIQKSCRWEDIEDVFGNDVESR
jgi:hypothetical protein